MIQRALLAALLASALVFLPQTVRAESPYTQQQNVVYAEEFGIGYVMDIFSPTGTPNGLGIIDVASGAFHSDRGKIEDHRRAQVYDIFCKKGYKVFAVRPGSVTKFTLAEMLANLKKSIVWVKEHAKEQGVDPDRLGITGGSAGGHLASLAAVTGEEAKSAGGKDTTVKAAAVFFPVTDFLTFKSPNPNSSGGTGEEATARRNRMILGAGSRSVSEEELTKKYTEVSPARLVTSEAPPFLVIHGDADPMVPLQQSELLVDNLKKAGVSAELIVKKGGGHPWLTIHEEVQVMADWFDKQLAAK